jgi:hypothetical protein
VPRPGGRQVREVRKVAPGKMMLCAEFRLPGPAAAGPDSDGRSD